MYFVYILLDPIKKRFYIGRTNNLTRRLKEHFGKKCWTTSRMKNIELIYYEAFKSKLDTIRREKYFKTTKGRTTLKLMLRESLK